MMVLKSDPFFFQDDLEVFNSFLSDNSLKENEVNCLVYVFKKISICNVLVNHSNLRSISLLNGFIYDVLSSLVAIFDKRERYFQLNLRSMIENIARICLSKEDNGGDFDLFVRRDDFSFLKENFKKDDWVYLHDQYLKSCGFIHSSPSVKLNINSKFNELLEGDLVTCQKKMISDLFKIVKRLSDIVFGIYARDISDIFYRNQRCLKKMAGDYLYNKHFS